MCRDRVEEIHPGGVIQNDNIFHREQFAWRLIGGKAVYVQYLIFAPEDMKGLASVSGVKTSRSGCVTEIRY